jgi:hypothetical protein
VRAVDPHDAVAPPRPSPARLALAGSICAALFAGIVALFWLQDLQFSRPTPVPAGWVDVAAGTPIVLPARIADLRRAAGDRPVLLHFFNPSCPCSRFNLDHVRALEKAYGDRVTFVAVLAQDTPATLVTAYARLGVSMPYYVDDGRLAAAVGAYSTPQAVILDTQARLIYRGNYNVTRYCRDRDTEFARIALDHLLTGQPRQALPAAATTAYGCPLRHPLRGRAARSGEGA